MSEQNNVQLKPVIIEVALTEHLPYHIRIKAIKSLANFGDPSVIDKIIILLDEPNNYIFYDHIVDLILSMDVMSDYEEKLRQASFNAMNNQKELEE
jgi:HEAT repeat protein